MGNLRGHVILLTLSHSIMAYSVFGQLKFTHRMCCYAWKLPAVYADLAYEMKHSGISGVGPTPVNKWIHRYKIYDATIFPSAYPGVDCKLANMSWGVRSIKIIWSNGIKKVRWKMVAPARWSSSNIDACTDNMYAWCTLFSSWDGWMVYMVNFSVYNLL